MSISKSYNHKTGITYVYEVYENYWDKELKKQITKRRLIGRIDPETGEIIPTRRKKKDTAPAASSQTAPEKAASAPVSPDPHIPLLNETKTALESIISSLDRQLEDIAQLKAQCQNLLSSITDHMD